MGEWFSLEPSVWMCIAHPEKQKALLLESMAAELCYSFSTAYCAVMVRGTESLL